MKQISESEKKLLSIIRQLLFLILSLVAILLLLVVIYIFGFPDFSSKENTYADKKITTVPLEKKAETNFWLPPDTSSLEKNKMREIILYGRDLIANTSKYLGPKGSVSHFTNGMNCQNCHLEAGTKIFGNNYSAVASTYPKFRARSGSIESIEKRVNDCVERSLNGKALNTESHEMKAIIAYIKWLGKNVTLIYIIQWIIIGNIATEIYKSVSNPLYLVLSFIGITTISSGVGYLILKVQESFKKKTI